MREELLFALERVDKAEKEYFKLRDEYDALQAQLKEARAYAEDYRNKLEDPYMPGLRHRDWLPWEGDGYESDLVPRAQLIEARELAERWEDTARFVAAHTGYSYPTPSTCPWRVK